MRSANSLVKLLNRWILLGGDVLAPSHPGLTKNILSPQAEVLSSFFGSKAPLVKALFKNQIVKEALVHPQHIVLRVQYC